MNYTRFPVRSYIESRLFDAIVQRDARTLCTEDVRHLLAGGNELGRIAGLSLSSELKPRLLCKRLEHGWNTADAFAIKVCHRIGAVEADGRTVVIDEAVASEQHARARLAP